LGQSLQRTDSEFIETLERESPGVINQSKSVLNLAKAIFSGESDLNFFEIVGSSFFRLFGIRWIDKFCLFSCSAFGCQLKKSSPVSSLAPVLLTGMFSNF